MTTEAFLDEARSVREAVQARLADQHRNPEEPGTDREMRFILKEIDAIEEMVRRRDLQALAALDPTGMGGIVSDWAPRIPLGSQVARLSTDYYSVRRQLLAEAGEHAA